MLVMLCFANHLMVKDLKDFHLQASPIQSILGNSIFSNTGLGIDLGTNGVTANDSGDGDTGANNLQNFAIIDAAVILSSTQMRIDGTLNSLANTNYRIEFFSNTTDDATGYGEGATYLGFVNVLTDGSGNATYNTILTGAFTAGRFIAMCAASIMMVPEPHMGSAKGSSPVK